jgi:DNA-binding response OmpR family regulator
MKILIVEDDVNLSRDLQWQFSAKDIESDIAYDGIIAEKMLHRNKYDCILADVNVPGKNGFELVKDMRLKQNTTPVIMLTAFGEIEDKLQGFDNGADDYVTKPFFFDELHARMKVIIKRMQQLTGEREIITIEDLTIDMKKREVYRANAPIKLTAREFEILAMLGEADGQTLSKKDILNRVWGNSFGTNTNTIEVFINLLRNKIDKNFEIKLIKTRIGFGYYLGKN